MAVALKIRVMASHGPAPMNSPVASLIYRAEAYDDNDRYRDRVWGCAHEHRTVEGALHCGQEWLNTESLSA